MLIQHIKEHKKSNTMANNRLYLVDTKNKEFICIGKGWGSGWEYRAEDIAEFLKTRFEEGDGFNKTNLIIMDENHELYDEYINIENQFEPQNQKLNDEIIIEDIDLEQPNDAGFRANICCPNCGESVLIAESAWWDTTCACRSWKLKIYAEGEPLTK